MISNAEYMGLDLDYEFKCAKSTGQLFVRPAYSRAKYEPVAGQNTGMPYNALVFLTKDDLIIVQIIKDLFSTMGGKSEFKYWHELRARFIWCKTEPKLQLIPLNRKDIPESLNPMKLEEFDINKFLLSQPAGIKENKIEQQN